MEVVVHTLDGKIYLVDGVETIADLKRQITGQDWDTQSILCNGQVMQADDGLLMYMAYYIVQNAVQKRKPVEDQAPPAKKLRTKPPREIECALSLCSRTGKKFTCPECQAPTCLSCLATGLQDHKMEIKCPSCMTDIPENIWQAHFPSSFVNRVLRKRAGFDLPSQLAGNRALLQDRAAAEVSRRELLQEWKVLAVERQRLSDRMDNLKKKAQGQEKVRDTPVLTSRTSNIPCLTPTCHAYLNASGKCTICAKTYCLRCHTLAHLNECDPDNLATRAELSQYKPCPNVHCGALIEKVSGCNVMFCTMCKTQYDERTREINTGPAQHNPELAAWVSRGNVFGEILPNLTVLLREIPQDSENCRRAVNNFHRSMQKFYEMRVDPVALERTHQTALDRHQIDYIIGSKATLVPYQDTEYQRDLARTAKANQYAKDSNRLVLKACDEGAALLRTMKVRGLAGFQEMFAALEHFVQGLNAEIIKLADFYGIKAKGIFSVDPESTYTYLSYN